VLILFFPPPPPPQDLIHLTFEGTANFTASKVGFFPFMLILDARELCVESFFFFLPLFWLIHQKHNSMFSPKNITQINFIILTKSNA